MVRYFSLSLIMILLWSCPALYGDNSGSDTNSTVSDNLQEKGDRILGIDILQIPENGSYAGNLNIAINQLHADQVQFSFDWNQLEKSRGIYDMSPLTELIGTYWDKDIKLSLIFRPLDTAGTTIPSLIPGKKSDYDFSTDPAPYITRFNNLLTRVYNHKVYNTSINDKIFAIYIGNEIDCYLGEDEVKWANYKKFYLAAAAKAKELWGDKVRVSTVSTYHGLINPGIGPKLKDIYRNGDVIALTYYPQKNDFTVKSPDCSEKDFALLVKEYGFRPIFIVECGYQSSPVCDSSEEKQALFIKNVFTSWDKYQEHIKQIDFSWLFDISEAAADEYVETYHMKGHPHEQGFKHYLASLGLCTYSGTEKKAYLELVNIVKKRGW